MYKVFVNEKKLTLSKHPQEMEKKLAFEGVATLEMAVDLLENTSSSEINVYGEQLDDLWAEFCQLFKIVKAAGGVIRNQNGEILFIYRLGRWDLPKGKIEKGESEEQAAIREVGEETGLKNLKVKKFLNSTFHIYTERNGQKILKTTYWFKMTWLGDEVPKAQTEEGISEVCWKNEAAIQNDVLPKTFENIKLILQDDRNS